MYERCIRWYDTAYLKPRLSSLRASRVMDPANQSREVNHCYSHPKRYVVSHSAHPLSPFTSPYSLLRWLFPPFFPFWYIPSKTALTCQLTPRCVFTAAPLCSSSLQLRGPLYTLCFGALLPPVPRRVPIPQMPLGFLFALPLGTSPFPDTRPGCAVGSPALLRTSGTLEVLLEWYHLALVCRLTP